MSSAAAAVQESCILIPKSKSVPELMKRIHRLLDGLSDEQAERLLTDPGFMSNINGQIGLGSRAPRQLAYRVDNSTRTYGKGYNGPIAIADQVARLRELFPDLKWETYDERMIEEHERVVASYALQLERPHKHVLSKGPEGCLVWPDWRAIADTYQEATRKMLDTLFEQAIDHAGHPEPYIMEYNHGSAGTPSVDVVNPQQCERTIAAEDVLRRQQPRHSFLIAPVQMGMGHRSKSVQDVQGRIIGTPEFCLGTYHVLVAILLHPHILKYSDDLGIVCGGDKVRNYPESITFPSVLKLMVHIRTLRLCRLGPACQDGKAGVPTGFLPRT